MCCVMLSVQGKHAEDQTLAGPEHTLTKNAVISSVDIRSSCELSWSETRAQERTGTQFIKLKQAVVYKAGSNRYTQEEHWPVSM